MLNVVYAADDNYAGLLNISLFSLLENNSQDFDLINVFILDDGISEKNKEKITNYKKRFSCEINFIETVNLENLDFEIAEHYGDFGVMSLTAYARLFLPQLLPSDLDRIIYLDCDSLVVGSFKDLLKIDLEDYYAACVLDCLSSNLLDYIGFGQEYPYFNSGFLFINLEKWREDKIQNKFIEYLSENQNNIFWHDQGVLNEVLKGKIKILEPKYNLQVYYQMFDYELANKLKAVDWDYYNESIFKDSRENPIFLHFAGLDYDRPWHNFDHKYAELYKSYAVRANSEEVVDYMEAPGIIQKITFKYRENRWFKLFLRIIPSKMIAKYITRNIIAGFELDKKYNEN